MSIYEYNDLINFIKSFKVSFEHLKGSNTYDTGNLQEDYWVESFNNSPDKPSNFYAITVRSYCQLQAMNLYDHMMDSICGDIMIYTFENTTSHIVLRIDLKVGSTNYYFGPISALSIYNFGSPHRLLRGIDMGDRHECFYLCSTLNGDGRVFISARKMYDFFINQRQDSDIKFRESQNRSFISESGIDVNAIFHANSYVNYICESDFIGTLELRKLNNILT